MLLLKCPFLGSDVELSDERRAHIAQRHPDLLPAFEDLLGETLAAPDHVRQSRRIENAYLFSRWYDHVRNGKYIVVVVIGESYVERYWIVTAYLARRLTGGTDIWTRD